MSWQPHGSSTQRQSEGGNAFSGQESKGGGQGNRTEFPLYIVNVPLDLNEEKLSEMFSQAGTVTRARCLPPKEGRNSCVGFISYNVEEEAEKAISLFNNIQMNHLTLKVDYTRQFKENRNQMPVLLIQSQGQEQGQEIHLLPVPVSVSSTNNFLRVIQGQSQFSSRDQNTEKSSYSSQNGYVPPNQPPQSSFQSIDQDQSQSSFGNQGVQNNSYPSPNGYVQNLPDQPPQQSNFQSSGQGMSQSSGHQNIANNPYSSHNGPVQTLPEQLPQQSSSFHSIGRGIHNYEYDNRSQLGSIGRGIHSASHEPLQNINQGPGVAPYSMNAGPGIPPSTGTPSDTTYGSYNYMNHGNPPQGNYSNAPQSSYNMNRDTNAHTEMNDMVNGIQNMQVTTPAQPFGSNQTFDSSQSFGSSQSFTTNQYQVSSRLPRAETGSSDKTCHKCGEAGHFARECPNNSSGVGGGNCHQCGQSGHFARECPNRSGGGSGGGGCHRCGEQGHFARECPNNSGGGGCHRCGEQGHFARECPNSSGGGGGTGGGGCHRCGEQGHFARECPHNSGGGGGGGGGGDGCHRCGESGHFARECPNGDQEGTCPRPAQRVDYIPPPIPDDVDLLFKSAIHKGINFDRFDNIPVKVTGVDPPAGIESFDELMLPDTLKANIGRADFTKPTPVQKRGIPIVLNGRDVMACAQTGSGKTIAFLLPVMAGMVNSRLPEASYLSGDAPSPAALCIAPTRELALQIYTEALKFSSGTYLRPVVCYGGVSVQHQLAKLERGCHLLIGTPGRLIDFVGRNKVNLTNVRYLILDEADRMLDMGFENDIRKIVCQFGMPEKTQRQTLMFSATFPDEIQQLAREFLSDDYLFLAVGSVGGTNLDIKQDVVDLDGDKKRSTLVEILGQSGTDKTLVFVERKRNADFLASWLSQNKYPATSISGDRTQKEREDALRDFRNGRAPILIATSVAARGLDIPDVKHVVNFDLPQQIEEYVHRIGRTGRIGNQGKATAFFDRRRDDKLARSLVKVLSDALQDVPNWLEEVAERALGTSYGPAGGKFASRDTRQFGGGNSGGSFGGNSGGNTSGDGNYRQSPTTNVSFTNQFNQQQTSNVQNGGDEEDWD